VAFSNTVAIFYNGILTLVRFQNKKMPAIIGIGQFYHGGMDMGDKGGRKDKNKSQKQKKSKDTQKEKKKQDKQQKRTP